jgi:putative oxidoreductase
MPERSLAIAGRVLLSVLFILSAVGKIMTWDVNLQYMVSKGLPLIPVFLGAATAVELACGLALLFGWHARWGALLLVLYLIPLTLLFHNFWALSGPDRQTELVNFLKNLAIMGGLLTVAAYERVTRPVEKIEEDRGATGYRRAG